MNKASYPPHLIAVSDDEGEPYVVILPDGHQVGRLPYAGGAIEREKLHLTRADGGQDILDLRTSPHLQLIQTQVTRHEGLMLMSYHGIDPTAVLTGEPNYMAVVREGRPLESAFAPSVDPDAPLDPAAPEESGMTAMRG